MKRLLFFFAILALVQYNFAGHIVRSPGSTIDVFTEIAIKDILIADTIFIEGGTGSVTLKAGPIDDGTYYWDIHGGVYTYTIVFSYSDANITYPDGSQGRLMAMTKNNQDQFFYIMYRALPLKPSTPSGDEDVCVGTSTNYSSTSTNAESYEWTLSPVEAGTLSNETTGTVTINWSSSWTGDATLTSKGVKEATYSPASNPLTITVHAVPSKPLISGDGFVENGNSSIYTGTASDATSWAWFMSPSELANSTPNGQTTTLSFLQTGTLTLTAQATNMCGNSEVSDGFSVKIVDISGMQAQIDQFKIDTALYRQQTRDSSAVAQDLRLKLADSTTVINNLRIDNALFSSLVNYYRNDSIPELHGIITTVTGERDQALQDLQEANNLLTAANTRISGIATLLGVPVEQIETAIGSFNQQITDLTSERDQALEKINEIATLLGVPISEIESMINSLIAAYAIEFTLENVTTHVINTEVGNFTISLYPNPNPGEVFIDCDQTMESLKVINLQGQILLEKAVNGASTSFIMYRNTFTPNTMYFAVIKLQNGGTVTMKYIFSPK